MSAETPAANSLPQVLPVLERRVLGVLVEKAKTTPDAYPLSVNALVVGCNQKSNRDPVMNIADEDVEDTLLDLQNKRLVTRITGGRVERWRHNLYELWNVNKVELAVLAELLLRGPQTEGELRGRAGRMEPIADLDTLRDVLKPLKERELIVYLGPEGRRGVQLTHGFHSPQELEVARSHQETSPPASTVPRESAASKLESQLTEAQNEIAALRTELAQLKQSHEDLAAEFRQFKQSLES